MPADVPMQPVILGTAINYEWPALQPFVESLRATGYTGDVVLLVGNMSIASAHTLEQQGVTCLTTQLKGLEAHTINTSRYFVYQAFLQQRPHYTHLLFTDVRDVIFQANPFSAHAAAASSGDDDVLSSHLHVPIACVAEERRIRDCPINRGWIEQIYGAEALQRIGDCLISCSGTTFFQAAGATHYLARYAAHVQALGARVHGRIADQAIHNMMLHNGELAGAVLYPNRQGPVLTLGYMPDEAFTFNAEAQLLNANGRPAPIVHQYDRHTGISKAWIARYLKRP